MWEREISVLLPGRDQTLFCSQLKKHSLTLSPLHNIQKMLFFHSDLKNSMFEVVPRKSAFYILKNVQFNGGLTQTWPHHPVRATAAPSRAQAVVHVCDDLHEPESSRDWKSRGMRESSRRCVHNNGSLCAGPAGV